MTRDTARNGWIDRARAVTTATVLWERGILKSMKGRNGRFAGPCPNCGGRDRFAVNLKKGSGGGVFRCRGCHASGGDAISFVCFIDGCDFLSAVETLVGPAPDGRKETDDERRARKQQDIERRERLERERHEREQREANEARARLRYCDVLWWETVPLPPLAIAYFERRGIDINAVPDQGGLRFHAACPFDGPTLPCILGRFTDPVSNARGGIWRRPISGEKPKSLGPVRRRVIRLWPDEHVERGLAIGEGVETVLAAASRIAHRGTVLQPAWACGCADSLENFPVLPVVEFLTILADHDANRAGQDAARACAEQWAEAGREAEVLTPTTLGEDFNDVARELA